MKRLVSADRDGEECNICTGMSSINELRKIAADNLPSGRGWPIIEGYIIRDDQYML